MSRYCAGSSRTRTRRSAICRSSPLRIRKRSSRHGQAIVREGQGMTTGGKPQVDLAMIDRHVDDLVWEQATRTPDAIAAVCDHEQLTYRDLAARACQLAEELRRRGITGGSLVGLHLDRSLDMHVAILAVLRAGAAYVPLDPDFPAERLRYMVQDSGLPLVLAHGRLVADAPFDGVEIVEVDALPGDLSSPDLPAPSPAGGGAGRDLAYVLYTSGSTGRPKGVALEH